MKVKSEGTKEECVCVQISVDVFKKGNREGR